MDHTDSNLYKVHLNPSHDHSSGWRLGLEALEIIGKHITSLLIIQRETSWVVQLLDWLARDVRTFACVSPESYLCPKLQDLPIYQLFVYGNRVLSLSSLIFCLHSSSYSLFGLRYVIPSSRAFLMASTIQSPWSSTHDGPFENAVGP